MREIDEKEKEREREKTALRPAVSETVGRPLS